MEHCMYGTIWKKYKTLGPNYGAIELCGVLVLIYKAIELCGLLALCHGTPGLWDNSLELWDYIKQNNYDMEQQREALGLRLGTLVRYMEHNTSKWK